MAVKRKRVVAKLERGSWNVSVTTAGAPVFLLEMSGPVELTVADYAGSVEDLRSVLKAARGLMTDYVLAHPELAGEV